MFLTVFTLFHVLLSLIGIGAGLVVLRGLLVSDKNDRWTAIFLATTAATSVTGFLFPFHRFLPSHAIGILSLAVLAVAAAALYKFNLAGGWRKGYVIAAVMALYFNVFVLVAQMFQKLPALKVLAPTQTEAPFAVAQGAVLVAFLALGIRAAMRFQAAGEKEALRRAAGAGGL